MILRCDEPSCGCQAAPPEPIRKSIELLIRNTKTGDTYDMTVPHTELDLTFDIVDGQMVLKQKVRDPKIWPKIQHETWVQFDQINHKFVNLEGLADNSLLLTVSFDSSKPVTKKTDSGSDSGSGLDWCSADDLEFFSTKLRICQQTIGWYQGTPSNGGPLYEYLTKGLNGKQILQLRLPNDRIEGWQTVSLILLTYRKINPVIWHRVRSRLHNSEVAGFDWTKIEDELGSKHVWAFANVKAPARRPRLVAESNISNLAARFGLEDKPRARGFAAADISKAPGRKHKDLDSSDLGFKSL